MITKIAILAACLIAASSVICGAQETVFNVPSADVLDRGKVYAEFDFAHRTEDNFSGYTPRIVIGTGHRIEVGANINNIFTPGPSQATITPTIKWKAWENQKRGLAFLAGDNFFIPVQNRGYNAGNWIYAELAKSFRTQTRITAGVYDFTANVVAPGNRAGGQFAIEQPLGKRLTVAADWFTGRHSAGYLTLGTAVKITNKWTGYFAYEIGNSGLTQGNHLLLVELGWNVN